MTTAFYPAASFKPQVLTRQEGFHLPSPTPSTPPSSEGTPPSAGNPNNNSPGSTSANNFDAHNLFISPPSYLSVPETFRRFPSADNVHGSMDFSEELASLITNPHPSSHERSTQSSVNAYEDYRSQTHNIFDISAPTSHHGPQSPHSPYSSGQSAFSLPPPSSLTHHPLHSPSSSLHTSSHPLHEFATHFNSTVPAIGSSMRYEPSPHNPHNPNGSAHPFALNTNASSNMNGNSNVGAEPSSVNSFTSHMSSLSTFSNMSGSTTTTNNPQNEFHLTNGANRQTPSPVLPPPTPISTTSGRDNFSRSRSRSRSSVSTQQQPINPANPPSTNGGPARRTRTKRGSVSSVSPPPLHRGHITQPLVIPGANAGAPGSARSPLSLHTSGWFGMGTPGSLGNGGMGEYSLPTPESVHGGFASFGSTGILQGSPKDMSMGLAGQIGSAINGVKGESPPSPNDLATKQALIANEKRRRRRESHNAVERRRRDNINEKISELATLIPECLLDPNATMTMPPSLSTATSDDLLFGVPSPLPPDSAKQESKELDVEDKEPSEQGANGVIKANKGMILRKSVEYIRYLQQLVSAQASRNRDLEQQLQVYKGSSSPNGTMSDLNGSSPDEDPLMLHEEVSDFNLSLNLHHADGKKRFNGFELESVAEMDQDTEHHDEDHDMDRPRTADTGASPLSAGSPSDDPEDGEEEERGRKGRDGRPMGMNAAMKVEDNMETS